MRDNKEFEKIIKLVEELFKTIKAEEIILLDVVDSNVIDKLRTTKRTVLKKIISMIDKLMSKELVVELCSLQIDELNNIKSYYF